MGMRAGWRTGIPIAGSRPVGCLSGPGGVVLQGRDGRLLGRVEAVPVQAGPSWAATRDDLGRVITTSTLKPCPVSGRSSSSTCKSRTNAINTPSRRAARPDAPGIRWRRGPLAARAGRWWRPRRRRRNGRSTGVDWAGLVREVPGRYTRGRWRVRNRYAAFLLQRPALACQMRRSRTARVMSSGPSATARGFGC
jgi:hypothetical protein